MLFAYGPGVKADGPFLLHCRYVDTLQIRLLTVIQWFQGFQIVFLLLSTLNIYLRAAKVCSNSDYRWRKIASGTKTMNIYADMCLASISACLVKAYMMTVFPLEVGRSCFLKCSHPKLFSHLSRSLWPFYYHYSCAAHH